VNGPWPLTPRHSSTGLSGQPGQADALGYADYLLALPGGEVTLTEGKYWLAVTNPSFEWIGAIGTGLGPEYRFRADWTIRFSHGNSARAFGLYGTGSPGGGLPVPDFSFDLSQLPAKTYGDPSFNVAGYASTNSSGPRSFDLGAESAGCSVTLHGEVTITGAATGASYCTLLAFLDSDGTYGSAGPLSQSFHIAKVALTVTANNVTITYGRSPIFSVGYTQGAGWSGSKPHTAVSAHRSTVPTTPVRSCARSV
jgi:hypothetical protein